MSGGEIYSVGQVALKIGVSTRTIQREIHKGKLKASKAGRKYLVSETDLKAYLTNSTVDVKAEIHEFLTKRKYEMVSLLQKLVSIPSETGDGNAEEKLAYYIKTYLDRFGIRSVVQGSGDSIAIHASFGIADKGLLFDCPLDTTHAGDLSKWKYPPFDGVIHGNRMYGRGVMDAKAGIVSMIYSLLALKNVVGEEGVRVEMVFDGGEQDGRYAGIREVMKKQLPVETGIIGYAGDDNGIGIGCRGYHRYRLVTHGKARHTGSQHNPGVNAVSKMVAFIAEMEKTGLPSKKSKYFRGPRITFSIIRGGEQVNIVPDICESYLDARTLPGQNHKDVERVINKVIEKIKTKDKDFEIDVEYLVGEEGYLLEQGAKIIRSLKPSIEEVNDKNARLIAHGPSHIGTYLYHHFGIPMVVWGPVGGNGHSYNEFVEINSVPKTAEMYAHTVLRYFDLT